MVPFKTLVSLLEKATAQASRSTVLKELRWLIAILVGAILAALKYSAPEWLLIMLSVFVGMAFVLYLGTYVFCLVKDRDALRSESYLIQKQVIERTVLGDSVAGIFELEVDKGIIQLRPGGSSAEGKAK